MCGIFGFIGHECNRALLKQLAIIAGRRGPHSCGWTFRPADVQHQWKFGDQGLRTYRFEGSAEVNADQLPLNCSALIGHSRLATSGGHDDLSSAQPVTLSYFDPKAPCGANVEAPEQMTALVHNGVARFREGLKPAPADQSRYSFKNPMADVQPETKCDSELILRRAAGYGCWPAYSALSQALDDLEPEAPYAVMMLKGRELFAAHVSLPLHWCVITGERPQDRSFYFCSVEFEDSVPLPERKVISYAC